MTNEEIDRLVAERVLGLPPTCTGAQEIFEDSRGFRCLECGAGPWPDWSEGPEEHPRSYARYTICMNHAWKVVEKLGMSVLRLREDRWLAGCMEGGVFWWPGSGAVDGHLEGAVESRLPGRAICLAALLAIPDPGLQHDLDRSVALDPRGSYVDLEP